MKRIVKAAVLAANATGLFSRVQIPVATGRSFSKSQSLNQMSGPVWNLGRLNHVAIAVPDLGKASSFYRDVLGAQVSEASSSRTWSICCFCRPGQHQTGTSSPTGERQSDLRLSAEEEGWRNASPLHRGGRYRDSCEGFEEKEDS
ncbi:methylmalonyl-CoA epimerase, mitochondrial [Peromyscus leucopus]|uniref:methylmalonyl-CoA epimerase, mitochondrial n=1 Tax=Peromyscus leucopus TaxID=10041 RepID=UPI0010A0E065|nr:methylmalonyl-CoA epimerase, mitochondrial [Peromyscus leucopus]